MKVSKRLLEMIQCIFCGNDLSLEGGVLKCDGCSAEFRIVNGIPSFIESLLTENEFKQAEFYNDKATTLRMSRMENN